MSCNLNEEENWRKKFPKKWGRKFLRGSEHKFFKKKLVPQKPIETLLQTFEIDYFVDTVVRRDQFATFFVLEVCCEWKNKKVITILRRAPERKDRPILSHGKKVTS